jgi:hypothetical protein
MLMSQSASNSPTPRSTSRAVTTGLIGPDLTKAAWSEVLNQYRRRADLVPNLVQTVKGYAQQERQTLTAVVDAPAKATQMQPHPDILINPAAFNQFQDNQARSPARHPDEIAQPISRSDDPCSSRDGSPLFSV